jgi:hypothetical protein
MKRRKVAKQEPKTFLTINKKLYRCLKPDKALAVADKLSHGNGIYKVHVIYGKEQISKRKQITIDNVGKYTTAKEAKLAIKAFLDSSLWLPII